MFAAPIRFYTLIWKIKKFNYKKSIQKFFLVLFEVFKINKLLLLFKGNYIKFKISKYHSNVYSIIENIEVFL